MSPDNFERNELDLGGVKFPIIGQLQRQVVSQFPGKTMVGDASRGDKQLVSSWAIADLRGGMGIENMVEREHPDRFWYSQSVWTLDSNGITLAPLVSQLGDALGFLPYKVIYFNSLVFALGVRYIKTYNTSTAVWDTVLDVAGVTFIDAVSWTDTAMVDHIIASTSGSAYYHSTTGASGAWTSVATLIGYMTVFDNKLVGHNSGYVVYCTDPTNAAPPWTTLVRSPARAGLVPIATYRSPDSREELIVIAIPQGVYFLDFWTGKAEKVIDLSSQQYANNGVGMIVHNNEMWIPNRERLLRLTGSTLIDIGLTQDDGLPTGEDARTLCVGGWGTYVIAGIGRHLMIWNGRGWHNLYVQTLLAEEIFSVMVGDGVIASTATTIRVYWANGTTGAYYVYFIDLPAETLRPIKFSSSTYQASGVIDSGYFDAGFPEWPKVAVSVQLVCSGMSANETCTVKYRKDTETSWTTLGTAITANGVTEFFFPNNTTPTGMEFKKIQFQRVLARGSTNTKTPVIEAMILNYYRVPDPLYGFSALVDCTHGYKGKTAQEMVEAMETAIATSTLVAFKYFPGTTRYVKLLNMVATETTGRGREGKYRISIAEMG